MAVNDDIWKPGLDKRTVGRLFTWSGNDVEEDDDEENVETESPYLRICPEISGLRPDFRNLTIFRMFLHACVFITNSNQNSMFIDYILSRIETMLKSPILSF